ncbi:MAG TPA: glycosyltransferase family 39 protein [Terriglobales bacterium]|nr:glycosyltransferase family 39 protein [Terriglobales bacterium]
MRGRDALWIWLIAAMGAALRLIALGYKSFWIDEIASVAIARRPAPFFWHFLWHDEGNMALYYVLLRPWLHFGYGEGMIRALSVIPGVASIPVMYLLGRRLFGRVTGILAAALLALSPPAIAVSQGARAYSFVVLAVLLSTYLFVLLIEEPRYDLACWYGVAAGVTCYFHYFGVLVPAAHAISLLALPRDRRPWRPLLSAAAIVAAMAAPILWLIHAQDVGHISWVQSPSLLEVYHLGVFLAANGGKAVGAVLLALESALVGVFVAKFTTLRRDGVDEMQRWRYTLIVSAAFSPIVITLLASIVRPAFYHRFLIICLPGWLLIITIGIEQLRGRTVRVSAIVSVCVLSLVTTVLTYRRVTEDWRGAVTYLIANTHAGDRVLYYQSVGEFAAESYRDWLPGAGARRPGPIAIDSRHPNWMEQIDQANTVWLVLYRTKLEDADSAAIEADLERRYQRVMQRDFPGITVVEYKLMR